MKKHEKPTPGMNMKDRLRRILLKVNTPAQYLGGEVGITVKPEEVGLFALHSQLDGALAGNLMFHVI